jgi:hypothetical protein
VYVKLVGETQIVAASRVLGRKQKAVLVIIMENVVEIKICQTTAIVHAIKGGKV